MPRNVIIKIINIENIGNKIVSEDKLEENEDIQSVG